MKSLFTAAQLKYSLCSHYYYPTSHWISRCFSLILRYKRFFGDFRHVVHLASEVIIQFRGKCSDNLLKKKSYQGCAPCRPLAPHTYSPQTCVQH